jgi:hypothetical protein
MEEDFSSLNDFIKDIEKSVEKIYQLDGTIYVNGQRVNATPKEQIKEYGSTKQKLAQTNQQADVNRKVDQMRRGDTSEIDEETVNKYIKDIIDRNIFGDLK